MIVFKTYKFFLKILRIMVGDKRLELLFINSHTVHIIPANYCFNAINTALEKYIKYLSRDKYRDIYRDKLG